MPYSRPDFHRALLNFRLILKFGVPSGWGPGKRCPSLLPLSAALPVTRVIHTYPHLPFNLSIAVRLRGPLSTKGTGRVEVFYNGQWASVCDDNWNINDARTVCLQLGYKNVVQAIRGVLPGSGNLWLHDVNCTGHEQCLSSCFHRGWVTQSCTHFNDAGVECSYTGKAISVYYRQLSQNSKI